MVVMALQEKSTHQRMASILAAPLAHGRKPAQYNVLRYTPARLDEFIKAMIA
jgi:hypothetical protein